jgi:hypothetical protein
MVDELACFGQTPSVDLPMTDIRGVRLSGLDRALLLICGTNDFRRWMYLTTLTLDYLLYYTTKVLTASQSK